MSMVIRLYSLFKGRKYVFILSAMRSGSTLLKSLLATRHEVSHLPEINFNKYKKLPGLRLRMLSEKPVLVIKKPGWYGEANYPQLPAVSPSYCIVLIRNPYFTIRSIMDMEERIYSEEDEKSQLDELINYWCDIYGSLMELSRSREVFVMKYESLIGQPVQQTHDLFSWLGLGDTEGTDRYAPPGQHEWSWFNDDGGEKIRTLEVQKPSAVMYEDDLLVSLRRDKRVQEIMSYFGYSESDLTP